MFLTKYWTTILPYEFLFTLTISINIIFFSILAANHLADWLHFKTQSAVQSHFLTFTIHRPFKVNENKREASHALGHFLLT